MHNIIWKIPEDPDKYVREVLSREADDIPEEKINAGKWEFNEVLIDQIRVNEEMVKRHDKEAVHILRRDKFIESITKGRPIYPLIVLGKDMYLIDGYARFRALKKLGVRSVEVVAQVIT